jgi:hypothetical protein
MANTLSPFGFSPNGTLSGSTPNFRLSRRYIASSNATAIFTGDVVMPVTSTATGYIVQYSAGTVPPAGVFMGCKYLSVSQGRQVWSPYWPGSDANGDVTAYVIDNPDALFVVQSGTASAVTLANINSNATVNTSTAGTTINGRSGMALGTIGTTSTYPFIIVDLITTPTGQNGTDITTAYNWVVVGWNLEIFKAGATSIS